MSAGIYEIINTKNNRKYIGSSVNIEYRLSRHKLDLNKDHHHSRFMQRDWNKDCSRFMFIKLEFVDPSLLIEREQYYIDILKPEYNSAPKAYSSLGIVRSKEFKEKLSNSLSGKNNPMYGRKQSEETKKKISAIHKGKKISTQQREKMSLVLKGRKRSEETKQRMKIANKKRERLSNGQYAPTKP